MKTFKFNVILQSGKGYASTCEANDAQWAKLIIERIVSNKLNDKVKTIQYIKEV